MPNKNSFLDPIPNWLLKECFDELCPILLFIVNTSITGGEFPQTLKQAYVTPIIKDFKDDHDDLKNYRPISNLSTLSKILERCMYVQINNYLAENSLYCEEQSGYRKGHSCETLLVSMFDDVIKETDNNNLIAMILLDLSAAFDAIDHCTLLNKLEHMYGIQSHALKLIKSYLENRSFTVCINGKHSSIDILLYGVPQGSILGPILFILYTKELSSIVEKYGIKLKLYADDSTLYLKLNSTSNSTETESAIIYVQNCLHEIKAWMVHNFMKLNDDKTQLLVFGKQYNLNKYPTNIELNFDGTIINNIDLNDPKMKDKGKSLGVFLKNDTSMTRQIASVKQSSYNVLHNLRDIKEYLTEDTKLLLINSLVISKIDFCNALYMNIPQYQINILHKLLNYCIRFIYNLPKRMSVRDYYLKSHILPAKLRIKFKCLLIIHKCIYGSAPMYLKSLLEFRNDNPISYSLRSTTDNLALQTVHTARTSNFAKRGFSVYAPCIWNELPMNLRSCTNTETFKKLLKTFLFRQYEESLAN